MFNESEFPLGLVAEVEVDFDASFVAWLADTASGLMQTPSERDIKTMGALLCDLTAIHGGRGPTAEVLAVAPLLTNWRFKLAPDGLRLTGSVVGHPSLGDRERIATSPVYAVDPKASVWARSWNRFYRLGAPGAHRFASSRADHLY